MVDAFEAAYLQALMDRNDGNITRAARSAEIDRVLQRERVAPDGGKQASRMQYGDLPVGTFIELQGDAHVVLPGALERWSFGGYAQAEAPAAGQVVSVLTPPSVVRMFRAGFRPQIDASATIPRVPT